MRVRSLQTYVKEENLLGVGRVDSLHGYNVGIDTAAWARSLPAFRDPLSDVMGGLPLRISEVLKHEINTFESRRIHPIFLFEGVTPVGHSLFLKLDPKKMYKAWEAVLEQNQDKVLAEFSVISRLSDELLIYIARYLRSKSYRYGVAAAVAAADAGKMASAAPPIARRLAVFQCPYLCGHQMSYLMKKKYIDAAFGLIGYLLFGIPRVIVSIDFKANKFEWAEKDKLLNKWELTEHQLGDACLIAGTEYCHTLPQLLLKGDQNEVSTFRFKHAVKCAQCSPLRHLLNPESFHDADACATWTHLYGISRNLLTFQVAMGESGGLECFTADQWNAQLPQDIHQVLGHRLPDPLFGLMLQGLISPTLPRILAHGEWIDADGPVVLTAHHEHLLTQLRSYRLLALGLIARHLHPSFHKRRVTFDYRSRYISDGAFALNPHSGQKKLEHYCPNLRALLPWTFTLVNVEEKVQDRGQERPTFMFCLDWHARSMAEPLAKYYADLAIACPSNPTDKRPLFDGTYMKIIELQDRDLNRLETSCRESLALNQKRKQLDPAQNYVVALIMFSLLDCLDYFDHQSTPKGAPMSLGLVLKDRVGAQYEMEVLLCMELLKLGILTGTELQYGNECDYPSELIVEQNPRLNEERAKRLTMAAQSRATSAQAITAPCFVNSIRLISRVASLVTIRLEPGLNELPLQYVDFDIAAYSGMVKATKRALNLLIEGCIANICLQQSSYARVLTPDLFDPLNPHVPWFSPCHAIGGVLMKAFLQADYKSTEQLQECINLLPKKFSEVVDFWPTVLGLCEFWCLISSIVRSGCFANAGHLEKEFEIADSVLCLRVLDFLPHINNGNFPQCYPLLSATLEKRLSIDLASGMSVLVRPRSIQPPLVVI
eukprot:Blabericola_migrator_1__1081@NODE_1276_length_4911_cov_161_340215_g861_i0_p1_GENE_NODE_1276_length_4911_cov_161_340215_g861_i0NODE_1276_length_4911_cov_161_340215_g861_i0_p1_ORF_typecomplete_len885_score116_96MKT1_C/PF12246_8/4_6e28MKT1_N/PF12247_8/1_6e17XPG_I/PF00867_18/2_8e05XPG_N/PF00752_17/0_0034_NODE_1276_length_4911_cov_161_340215_g861_i012053859